MHITDRKNKGKTMKKNKLTIAYRILVILTFLLGVTMIVMFAGIASNISDFDIEAEDALKRVGSFGYAQLAYYIMSIVCFVGSIVVIKSTKILSSVFRTIFMGVTALVNVMSIKIAMTFAKCRNAFDASDELKEELSDSIDSFSESDFALTALTFFFVAAFLVFAITSIVYLCKRPESDKAQ